MKRRGNGSWITGALTAMCALAVACFIAWPGAGQPSAGMTDARQTADVGIPVSNAESSQSTSSDELQPLADSGDAEEVPFGGMEYQDGVVLVTLPVGISPAEALAIIVDETGLVGMGFAHAEDAYAAASSAAEMQDLVAYTVPGAIPLQDAISIISASTAVDAVQPNFIYHLNDVSDDPETRAQEQLIAQNFIVQDLATQAAANDPDLSKQWGLKSVYAAEDATGVGNAWDVVKTQQSVAVAVIDEGFDAGHEDLKGNIVATYNGATKKADVSEVSGENSHGTHVAGIIAATANNETGVAGVSYNAKLVLVKGYDETKNGDGKVLGFSSEALHESFSYIMRMKDAYNIRVVSMSVGGYTSSADGWSTQLIKDIDAATAAGIVVVCSGGNSPIKDSKGTSHSAPYIDYPANYSKVVGVINLQQNNNDPHDVSVASNSNYNLSTTTEASMNTGLNISAPGTDIYSTVAGSYGNKSGTSMAAPFVSGVLALVFAANPKLSASEATSLLYSTATDIGNDGWDQQTGYGEVNAYRAVTETSAYISGATTVQKGKQIRLAAPGYGSWQWSTSNASVATVSGGVVTGVSKGTARISAYLNMGIFGRLTRYQDVTVYDPVITGEASLTVGASKAYSIPSSPAGSWTWTSSDASIAKVTGNGTSATVVGLKPGTVTIKVALSSSGDVYAEKTITVAPGDLSGASVSISGTYTYNGSAQKPVPTVRIGTVTLTAGTDYTVSYPSDCTNAGTKTVTIKPGTSGRCTGSKTASYTIVYPSCSVLYRTHVQNVGWQNYVSDGNTSGTSGKSLRLEGINIKLSGAQYAGSIQYRTHVQNIGWESSWKSNDEMSGTSGRSLRLEAIQIRLTGDMAKYYDVYYRVHAQNVGWMGWAKNGASAGTAAHSYRLEAIQIRIVKKGSDAPGSTSNAYLDGAGYLSGVPDSESSVLYRTHVQNVGWQNYMRDGEMGGTSGRSLRLEGINIKLGGAAGSGGITYRTHVQNIGWQGWVSNGAMSGTSGRALRLEAIQIKLTGAAEQKYDVYYRVHCQNFGWMGWAKNGEAAGSAGYAYRLEGIQVKLVPKGGADPGSTATPFRQR